LATDRQTDKQTDEQMDSIDALSRSRYRERRLNNMKLVQWLLMMRPRPGGPLFAVPTVTTHSSTASVPITVMLYSGLLRVLQF